MNFFKLLMQLIPVIVQLVQQVETALPGKGQGAQKLNLVLNTVNAAAQAAPEVASAIQGHDLNAAVTGIVNATVSTLNAAGALSPKP